MAGPVNAPPQDSRREKIASMLRRCQGWDYRQPCIYQITITLADRRRPVLGEIEVRAPRGGWVALCVAKGLGLRPEDVEARVALSPLGAEILALWKRFAEFTPEVKPLSCEIMPDHLHAILQVTRPMARPLGNAIGGFKTGCEKIYRKLSLSAQDRVGAPVPLVGAACTVPSAKADGLSPRLFSAGFQDTILFHRGQLGNMFNYLRDNARRRAIKALFPDLFRVVGALKIALPGLGGVGHFNALGNRYLLGRQLVQAQVSRAFFGYRRDERRKIVRTADGMPVTAFASPPFEAHRDELFALAKKGAVIVSPCISDGEREIARLALNAYLPLITLLNKGFSPLQKPAGRYFDACADGRLLMLAPIAWPYRPGEKNMTRLDATALNRLTQWIVGEGAAEVNYHGMRPDNIDALACAAARIQRLTDHP